jgi:hypothetical protein
MCGGDFAAGLELAVGAPPPEDDGEKKRREEFLEALGNLQPTKEEASKWDRERDDQEERVDEFPLTTTAETSRIQEK